MQHSQQNQQASKQKEAKEEEKECVISATSSTTQRSKPVQVYTTKSNNVGHQTSADHCSVRKEKIKNGTSSSSWLSSPTSTSTHNNVKEFNKMKMKMSLSLDKHDMHNINECSAVIQHVFDSSDQTTPNVASNYSPSIAVNNSLQINEKDARCHSLK